MACVECGEDWVRAAFHDGDGWGLFWICTNEDCDYSDGEYACQFIDWPFGDALMSNWNLEAHGYEIIW